MKKAGPRFAPGAAAALEKESVVGGWGHSGEAENGTKRGGGEEGKRSPAQPRVCGGGRGWKPSSAAGGTRSRTRSHVSCPAVRADLPQKVMSFTR